MREGWTNMIRKVLNKNKDNLARKKAGLGLVGNDTIVTKKELDNLARKAKGVGNRLSF
jgi:hypothetical protein